jgi:hypothetical protein
MGQHSSRLASWHRDETERLLPPDQERVDHEHDGCYPPHGPREACPAYPYADLPVYTTIHRYVRYLHIYDLDRRKIVNCVVICVIAFGEILFKLLVGISLCLPFF